MQQKINYLPFVLSVIVAFVFVRRVRNENLSKYKKESGGIMWTLLFFDFIFGIGFALCGYYLIIIAFEFSSLSYPSSVIVFSYNPALLPNSSFSECIPTDSLALS